MAVGLQLEIGWLPPLINQSRNAKIQVGGSGYLDVSSACTILEIPTGPVTRAMGDVHPFGNPHYWLDPDNGRRIAKAIEQKLAQLDPAGAAYYAQRGADFDRRLGGSREALGSQDGALPRPQGDHLSPLLAELLRPTSAWRWWITSSRSRASRPPPVTPWT